MGLKIVVEIAKKPSIHQVSICLTRTEILTDGKDKPRGNVSGNWKRHCFLYFL
jgi:hypothetical protein